MLLTRMFLKTPSKFHYLLRHCEIKLATRLSKFICKIALHILAVCVMEKWETAEWSCMSRVSFEVLIDNSNESLPVLYKDSNMTFHWGISKVHISLETFSSVWNKSFKSSQSWFGCFYLSMWIRSKQNFVHSFEI